MRGLGEKVFDGVHNPLMKTLPQPDPNPKDYRSDIKHLKVPLYVGLSCLYYSNFLLYANTAFIRVFDKMWIVTII